jgi:uncharacterized protein (DUF1501 family)
MAITRRQFIKRTGLATAGAFLGPSLFRNPFLRRAFAANLDGLDRYFVVIFFDGGNDGLNTVVPAADGTSGALRAAYEANRTVGDGGLRLPQANLAATAIGTDAQTGTPLALHPGLIGLKHLWDAGALAVIQGCGDPVSLDLLSHDFSRSVWQTANPLAAGPPYNVGGWVGRYLAANYTGSDIPGVNIRDSVAPEFLTTDTSVLAINSLDDFGFPYDPAYPDDNLPFKRDAFSGLYTQAQGSTQPFFNYIGASGTATLGASESYPPLSDLYVADRGAFDAQYQALVDNGNYFADDLREVAKVIYGVSQGVANVKARSFELSNGGYDTHSDQGIDGPNDQQNQLHHQVGDALEVFYNDLLDMKGPDNIPIANKLCVMTWSEFSRRIEQNASGTDHGSQGPVFVIGGPASAGGKLNGGVWGNHPNINDVNDDGNTKYSQDPLDPYRSTDIRDVYGTILKHWLGVVDPSTILPLDGGDPTAYWTQANFDLPFLA